MTNILGNLADFTIKTIIICMTLVSIVFYARLMPESAFIFGFIGLLFIVALIVLGLVNIFEKK